MSPTIVVDIGNSRIKWGLCKDDRVAEVAAMTHRSEDWDEQIAKWAVVFPSRVDWAIASVVPKVLSEFTLWVNARSEQSLVISSYRQVPLAVDVLEPASVGMDRLLGALAARRRIPLGTLIVVDAGSAITINVLDDAFRGGAILPGLQTMAKSLNEHTAKLPLVAVDRLDAFPARDTESNIRNGILSAACGAVERCAQLARCEEVIFTGGDGALVGAAVTWPRKQFIRELNLDGLRIAAEASR